MRAARNQGDARHAKKQADVEAVAKRKQQVKSKIKRRKHEQVRRNQTKGKTTKSTIKGILAKLQAEAD